MQIHLEFLSIYQNLYCTGSYCSIDYNVKDINFIYRVENVLQDKLKTISEHENGMVSFQSKKSAALHIAWYACCRATSKTSSLDVLEIETH